MTHEMRLKNCNTYHVEAPLSLGTKSSKVKIRGAKA